MVWFSGTMGSPVREMFGSIATRYDLANSVLSFGLHHGWRRRLVAMARLAPTAHVLDCATGTGDLALEFARRLGREATVTGTDFTPGMLDIARSKATRQRAAVKFQAADVLQLPFADGEFDATSIAFGIRNITDPRAGLGEMARVVRPGGKVLVLEFGQPRGMLLAPLYQLYSRYVIPVAGWLVTGSSTAYRYLNRTSMAFPSGNAFVELMESTGRITTVEQQLLTGGIAYAYCATVV